MADVLIVCVREDEPQAKALADMFEAAGFSIGGAPSSDGALRSSGAGVVVWSQASIRSRPFLDAAQRVINANKAVVASLIEPPPPSSIGDSPAFDLSRWDGDPNDPALDPLFFAVDRMVNAARTSVGAAALQQPRDQAYDPPPAPTRAPPAPPPRAAAPATPSYRVPPQAAPDLGEEAEHWRSIRDSRDPADFMDYLSRYGPDGSFSEVAELRLKQLTSGETRPPPPRTPVRAPQNRPAAPSRLDTPTPTRRGGGIDLPSSTRAPAPTMARRPPIDRDYTRDLREPPKGQGGPLRAIVLIGLLGGAALLGGLYFGGGIGQPNRPTGDPALETAATPLENDGSDTAELEDAPSVPLSQAVDDRPPRPLSERQREQERAATREATQERQPTQTASTEGSGGPASLGPGPQSFTPPSQPEDLPTQMASVEPTIVASPSDVRPAAPAGSVVWTQRPSARRISELYPQRALREGVGGRVVLNCSVMGDLSVNCSVASETPANAGFGRAALSAASSYRARGTLSDGSSAIGSNTRIAMSFQAPE